MFLRLVGDVVRRVGASAWRQWRGRTIDCLALG